MVYSYHIFFKRFLWRLIGVLIIFSLMNLTQKLFGGSLFWPEELALVSLLTVLIDFPLNLFFLPLGLLFLALGSFRQGWQKGIVAKLTFQPYWPYLGLLFIGLNFWLLQVDWFYKLQP